MIALLDNPTFMAFNIGVCLMAALNGSWLSILGFLGLTVCAIWFVLHLRTVTSE